MELELTIEPHDVLVVRLREGDEEKRVSVHPSQPGIDSLTRALDAGLATGYGECFWPAWEGGQYWWIFKGDADSMEVIAMWTRGGASLWEHVFRAAAHGTAIQHRLRHEVSRVGGSQ